jgi:hypothetical protein
MRKLVFATLALIAMQFALASDSCSNKYDLPEGECLCDEEIKGFSVPSPSGLNLYATCNMHDQSGTPISLNAAKKLRPSQFDMGVYYYRGGTTLTGSVVKSDNGPLGISVFFIAYRPKQSKLSRLQEFTLLDRIYIGDEDKVGSRSLSINSENESWCADITIKVQKVQIYVADSCGEGASAEKFEVLRRGKYRKC